MCIIAAKPAGIKMPAIKTIENMWYRNHDGAGFMYAHDGAVHIEKGFMKLADFKSALAQVKESVDLDDVSVVMHFRIATHGGVLPANTHPFPVSTSIGALQKLKCKASLGAAHNGIISSVTPRKGISDTMEYIVSQLGPLYKGVPNFYENPHLMEMVENAIESKLALLTSTGALYTVGKFEAEEGILYSNSSYKAVQFTSMYWDKSWRKYLKSGWGEIFSYDGQDAMQWKECLRLHWLQNDGSTHVMNGAGFLLDMYENDYAVDSIGQVYAYNYLCDGFVAVPGAKAYDEKHEIITADEDVFASYEDIYEEVSPFDPDPPSYVRKKAISETSKKRAKGRC